MSTNQQYKKMNPAVKERLLSALENGEFKKTKGTLISDDGRRFCHLGVVCKLYNEASPMPENKVSNAELASHSFLPKRVAQWSGISFDAQRHIAVLNDEHRGWKLGIEFTKNCL